MNNLIRVEKHQVYMEIALAVSKRSTCLNTQVGAVIVKEDYIISTGYNGAPSKVPHCTDRNICAKKEAVRNNSSLRYESCIAVHAEQNAIIQAAKLHSSIKGASIYVTRQPCIVCAKMLINAGIKKIYINETEAEEISVIKLLRSVNIEVYFLNNK